MSGHAISSIPAALLLDPALFSRYVTGVPLRTYQLEVACAVLDSVLHGRGRTFAVMMSRQAGKNELAAQLEAQLLLLYRRRGGQIVKASPTFKPQTVNSLLRLQARLQNPLTRSLWASERGYMVRLGAARALFLSAQPGANVVGATASILLEADEAQDIPEDKWNRDFRPMGASVNVTTVLWGTAWTAHTLLAQTIRALERQEDEDGIRRVYRVPWERVAAEVPAYGAYVQGEIARLGAEHPLIRTQYALQELDGECGLFPSERRERLQGTHAPHHEPMPAALYALAVDVAGEDPRGELEPAAPDARDCTACTLFWLDFPPPGDPFAGRPVYRIVHRWWWRGLTQADLYARLLDIAAKWEPARIVVDATGLGAGLAAFLQARLGDRVRPFAFTAATKSQLGWDLLALCDTGRLQDHARDGSPAQDEFWRQVEAAEREVLPGVGLRLRWGALRAGMHDDLLVSAALCAVLEGESWSTGEAYIIPGRDPLERVSRSPF